MTSPSASEHPQQGTSQTNSARAQAARLRELLADAARQVRAESDTVSDKEARALFETTAEVLHGLMKAFEDYERRSEPAWQ